VNGTSSFSGRVETLRYGAWNPVSLTNSSDGFAVAHVVCKQLGFVGSSNAVAESAVAFGFPAASAQWLKVRYCGGSEAGLMECQCDAYTMYGYTQTVTCLSAELNSSNQTSMAANQLAVTCPSGGRRITWALVYTVLTGSSLCKQCNNMHGTRVGAPSADILQTFCWLHCTCTLYCLHIRASCCARAARGRS